MHYTWHAPGGEHLSHHHPGEGVDHMLSQSQRCWQQKEDEHEMGKVQRSSAPRSTIFLTRAISLPVTPYGCSSTWVGWERHDGQQKDLPCAFKCTLTYLTTHKGVHSSTRTSAHTTQSYRDPATHRDTFNSPHTQSQPSYIRICIQAHTRTTRMHIPSHLRTKNPRTHSLMQPGSFLQSVTHSHHDKTHNTNTHSRVHTHW